MSKSKKKKREKKGKSPSQRSIVVVAVVLVAGVAAGFLLSGGMGEPPRARSGEKRPVMSDRYFVGRIARAYRAAKEIPQVLDEVYCYCNCQPSFGHKSLLTCFTDDHGSKCNICMDEALMAYDLHKKGYNAEKIVEKIDSRYSKRI